MRKKAARWSKINDDANLSQKPPPSFWFCLQLRAILILLCPTFSRWWTINGGIFKLPTFVSGLMCKYRNWTSREVKIPWLSAHQSLRPRKEINDHRVGIIDWDKGNDDTYSMIHWYILQRYILSNLDDSNSWTFFVAQGVESGGSPSILWCSPAEFPVVSSLHDGGFN